MVNRKTIIFILILCLILVFVCMYKENNDVREKETMQTNGTPVSSHTIILDAGHGEPDRAELVQLMVLLKKK